MISLDLARRLAQAGVPWTPAKGDSFMIPNRDLDGDVFAISDMVVEVQELSTGRLFGFNGTTEWALDSIEQREVLWLPREDQLRALLADAFVSLLATPGGFVVIVDRDGRQERHIDIDAECAYARAVLSVCGSEALP
ncbi:MAG: pilus assembly protein CpaE [Nocardioidaceae bacterium]